MLSMHTWTSYFFRFLLLIWGFVCLLACLLYLSHSSYWIIPSSPHVTNVTSLNCIFLYLSPFSYCYTQIYKHLYKGGYNGLFYKNKIILQVWYVMRKYEMKWSEVAQSCPALCDPIDCGLSGSSIHGIFQARILEWVAISFSTGFSRPSNQTQVYCIAGRCFTIWGTRESLPQEQKEQAKRVVMPNIIRNRDTIITHSLLKEFKYH